MKNIFWVCVSLLQVSERNSLKEMISHVTLLTHTSSLQCILMSVNVNVYNIICMEATTMFHTNEIQYIKVTIRQNVRARGKLPCMYVAYVSMLVTLLVHTSFEDNLLKSFAPLV